MKVKVGILMYLLVASTVIQANNTFPQGTGDVVRKNNTIPEGLWNVVQVTVDKKTDVPVERKTDGTATRNVYDMASKSERNVYKMADKVQSYFPSPKSWEVIDSETIVLQYQGGREETAKYTLEGNQLVIYAPLAIQSYQCSMEGETMTLNCTYNYFNNPGSGGSVAHIEEKWTIVFTIK